MTRIIRDVIVTTVGFLVAFGLKTVMGTEIESWWIATMRPLLKTNGFQWGANMIDLMSTFWGGAAVALLSLLIIDFFLIRLASSRSRAAAQAKLKSGETLFIANVLKANFSPLQSERIASLFPGYIGGTLLEKEKSEFEDLTKLRQRLVSSLFRGGDLTAFGRIGSDDLCEIPKEFWTRDVHLDGQNDNVKCNGNVYSDVKVIDNRTDKQVRRIR